MEGMKTGVLFHSWRNGALRSTPVPWQQKETNVLILLLEPKSIGFLYRPLKRGFPRTQSGNWKRWQHQWQQTVLWDKCYINSCLWPWHLGSHGCGSTGTQHVPVPVQTITPPSTEGTPIHSPCQGRATAGITNKKGKSPETAGSLPRSDTKTSESRHHHCIQPAQWYSLCSEPLKGKWTKIGEWIRHSSLQAKSSHTTSQR